MTLRVLVLEPDLWRYLGILHVLEADPEITFLGERDCNKILAMKKASDDLQPDVIMLSYILLIDFKLSLLDLIKDVFPHASILVHGYETNIVRIAEVLVTAAKGYFLLPSEPEDLIEALKLVHRGLIWGPAEAVALMVERAGRRKSNKLVMNPEELVTPYELTILKLLEQGMSNKEIANVLGVAEVTIKSHLTKLYRRFNVHTRLQLLSYAMNQKLLADNKLEPAS